MGKLIISGWMILCIGIVCSCYDDKGNYSYLQFTPLEVIFQRPSGPYVIGQTVTIVPKIKWGNIDSTQVEYMWRLGKDTVSDEHNLTRTFNKTEDYLVCTFTIRDKKTGYGLYRKTFGIDVVSPYNEGWMILSEKEGKSCLSFLIPETIMDDLGNTHLSIQEHIDLQNTLYPEGLGEKPHKLIQHFLMYGEESEILIIQHGKSGSVELNGNTLEKVIENQKEFVGETYPKNFVPIDAIYWGCEIIAGSDGRAFLRLVPETFQTVPWGHNTLSYEGKQLDIRIIPIQAPWNYECLLLFDHASKRFLCIEGRYPNIGRIQSIFMPKEIPEGFTDLNHFEGSDLIYSTSVTGGRKVAISPFSHFIEYLNLIKTGTMYSIQRFDIVAMGNSSLPYFEAMDLEQFPFPGNNLVTEESCYAMLKFQRPYLFFSVGSTLYYCIPQAGQNQVERFYDFGNHKIVSIVPGKEHEDLAIGLDNGDFYLFDISDGNIENRPPEPLYFKEGFGEIKSIIYKMAEASDYSLWCAYE